GTKAVAPVRRLAPPPRAEARRHDVRGRGRRAGLYELPGGAPDEAAFHQPDRAAQRRDEAAPRRRRHPQRAVDHPPGRRAMLLEQNDEWAVQRARYMTLETIAP